MTEVQIRSDCPVCKGKGEIVNEAVAEAYLQAKDYMIKLSSTTPHLERYTDDWWDAYYAFWTERYPAYIIEKVVSHSLPTIYHIQEAIHTCHNCNGLKVITRWAPLSELPVLLVKDVAESST